MVKHVSPIQMHKPMPTRDFSAEVEIVEPEEPVDPDAFVDPPIEPAVVPPGAKKANGSQKSPAKP